MAKDNPLTRSLAGVIGLFFIGLMFLLCVCTMPWTLGRATGPDGTTLNVARYNAGDTQEARLSPIWWPRPEAERIRLNTLVPVVERQRIADEHGLELDAVARTVDGEVGRELRRHWPTRGRPLHYFLGTDALGRSLMLRVLAGGGISLSIGIAAAIISVFIGTLYGALAGYLGGKADAFMMRVVDILYGLPYILLVVLLAVAVDAAVENWTGSRIERITEIRIAYVERGLEQAPAGVDREALAEELRERAVDRYGTGDLPEAWRRVVDVMALLVAIGAVSWLTLARVVRGQVLSLKNQPFVEAARAMGAPTRRVFFRHLMPNLVGAIVVYATLAVPQAILQESFLSFLGIGVRPPLPSWGNLAAEGLGELNTHKSDWWLLLFPCLLLGTTLLAVNFVGEGLREAFDPKRSRR